MTQERGARVAGVDGCRAGWIGVVLSGGALERVAVREKVADLLAELGALDVVGIDIPIGLVAREHREADRAAREYLGPARSTVFLTPPRAAVEAPTYEEASRRGRELEAGGVSRQAFALFPRICEVDALKDDTRLIEVHPEVSFRRLAEVHPEISFRRADGDRLPPKRSWNGDAIRRRLLAGAGIVLPDDVGTPGDTVDGHDILDAAVAAWSAARHARGEAVPLPDPITQHDGTRPIAIWS